MLRLSRPQTAKKRKNTEDPAARERDLALLLERCKNDVRATRAAYNSPRLRPLLPEERRLLLLDAKINARGICANVPFLEGRPDARCAGAQRRQYPAQRADRRRHHQRRPGGAGSWTAVNAHGHGMTSLNKRSVAATLAHQAGRLRARAAGAAPARGLRQHAQVQETAGFRRSRRPPNPRLAAHLRRRSGSMVHRSERSCTTCHATTASCRPRLVNALIAGDRAELARCGNPLKVVSGISRAALCAAPGHVLICADFSSIEIEGHRLARRRDVEVGELPTIRRHRRQEPRPIPRTRAPDVEEEYAR